MVTGRVRHVAGCLFGRIRVPVRSVAAVCMSGRPASVLDLIGDEDVLVHGQMQRDEEALEDEGRARNERDEPP